MTDAMKRPEGPNVEEDSVVLDAKGLRAMAHPVRVQLVGLLRKYGPSTATRLAERLGVNSGTASYHLRQLGAAGFVEEDAERGNARERWWRSVHQMTELNDRELLVREPEATLAFLQSVVTTYTLRTQQTLNELQTMPRAWRDTVDMSDWALRLTPEETVALREELRAVVSRYRRDTPEAAAGAPEGAERVGVITHLLPELDTPSPSKGEGGPPGVHAGTESAAGTETS
ncbi:winged helix-turn-helix domain-containing protein [Streptomyces europaeiscabiei]|uniref:winged helix-turn-helix domain-containing protein n=1 Tax=Streptomyces europaeiscabiei TaxID=146819 RepID=UPI0029ACB593|nr:winged helix-turn-helix domain-containing protein [Streptomyces europaeiscabiei]MDX3696674.1 winged helix-turn-helix domain-containing protein [Streptomyces europaeiscabiei]